MAIGGYRDAVRFRERRAWTGIILLTENRPTGVFTFGTTTSAPVQAMGGRSQTVILIAVDRRCGLLRHTERHRDGVRDGRRSAPIITNVQITNITASPLT
jgi:hypothetical protein